MEVDETMLREMSNALDISRKELDHCASLIRLQHEAIVQMSDVLRAIISYAIASVQVTKSEEGRQRIIALASAALTRWGAEH